MIFLKVGYEYWQEMQGKNQFERFRILQTEVGEQVIFTSMSLILLGDANVSNWSIKCRYADDTIGHALGSCWRDFVSFANDFE